MTVTERILIFLVSIWILQLDAIAVANDFNQEMEPITIQNAKDIELIASIQADQLEFVLDITISHDDSMLVLRNSFDDSLIELWDLETLSLKLVFEPSESELIWGIEFSHDDNELAIQQDLMIQVWNTLDGTELFSLENNYNQMMLHPTEKLLVFTTIADDEQLGSEAIYIWDYMSQMSLDELQHPEVIGFDINQEGTYLLSRSTNGSLWLWDIRDLPERVSHTVIYEAERRNLFNFGFIDDVLMFFTLFDDSSFYLWNYQDNQTIDSRYTNTTTPIDQTIFQTRLANGQQFQIWDVNLNSDLIVLDGQIRLLDVTNDLKVGVGITSSGMNLLDLETGTILKTIGMNCTYQCNAALSNNGDYLLTWGEGNTVNIWSVSNQD